MAFEMKNNVEIMLIKLIQRDNQKSSIEILLDKEFSHLNQILLSNAISNATTSHPLLNDYNSVNNIGVSRLLYRKELTSNDALGDNFELMEIMKLLRSNAWKVMTSHSIMNPKQSSSEVHFYFERYLQSGNKSIEEESSVSSNNRRLSSQYKPTNSRNSTSNLAQVNNMLMEEMSTTSSSPLVFAASRPTLLSAQHPRLKRESSSQDMLALSNGNSSSPQPESAEHPAAAQQHAPRHGSITAGSTASSTLEKYQNIAIRRSMMTTRNIPPPPASAPNLNNQDALAIAAALGLQLNNNSNNNHNTTNNNNNNSNNINNTTNNNVSNNSNSNNVSAPKLPENTNNSNIAVTTKTNNSNNNSDTAVNSAPPSAEKPRGVSTTQERKTSIAAEKASEVSSAVTTPSTRAAANSNTEVIEIISPLRTSPQKPVSTSDNNVSSNAEPPLIIQTTDPVKLSQTKYQALKKRPTIAALKVPGVDIQANNQEPAASNNGSSTTVATSGGAEDAASSPIKPLARAASTITGSQYLPSVADDSETRAAPSSTSTENTARPQETEQMISFSQRDLMRGYTAININHVLQASNSVNLGSGNANNISADLDPHESSKTQHYSKLGAAFVNENSLMKSRSGGRLGGRGRGLMS